jgi:hypothetical protein
VSELLSLLGGGLLRLAPLLLKFFHEGRDLKYELLRMDKEAELERLRGQNRQQEIAAMTAQAVDTRWADGLVEAVRAQGQITGDKWLDRLNVSVRPIITYWWCICLYTIYKSLMIWVGVTERLPLAQLAPLIATDFDRGVVGSIIGFWFVDRSLRAKQ